MNVRSRLISQCFKQARAHPSQTILEPKDGRRRTSSRWSVRRRIRISGKETQTGDTKLFRGTKVGRGSGSQEQNPMASGEPTARDSWRTNQMDGDQISPWRLPSNRLPLIANFSRSCKDTLHGIWPSQSIQEQEKYIKRAGSGPTSRRRVGVSVHGNTDGG